MKATGRCTTCGARRTEKSAWFCDRHSEKSRTDLRSWREENRSAYRALLRASAARWRTRRKARELSLWRSALGWPAASKETVVMNPKDPSIRRRVVSVRRALAALDRALARLTAVLDGA